MTTTLEVPTNTASNADRLTIVVKILGERELFGRQELLITPTHGSGEAWVSADRVKVRKET